MTEQDRGAYMPQSDAPLAFDARSPRGGGRPMPMTLIASGGVLVLILGALFLAYKGGVRGAAGTGPAHRVGQPIAAIKVTSTDTQPQDPDANLDVYAAQNVPNVTAPTLAPPPEQPHARAAPIQLAATAAPPRLQVKSVAAPAVRIEAPEAAAPGVARTTVRPGAADQQGAAAALVAPHALAPATSVPAPQLRTAPAKATAPAPVKLAVAAPKTPPVVKAAAQPAAGEALEASAGGAAAVQIGAFSSRELAAKGYSDVSGLMAARMGGHGSHVEPVARDGKTMFRTTVTGFSDRAAAKTFCEALSAKGHSCFVKAG